MFMFTSIRLCVSIQPVFLLLIKYLKRKNSVQNISGQWRQFLKLTFLIQEPTQHKTTYQTAKANRNTDLRTLNQYSLLGYNNLVRRKTIIFFNLHCDSERILLRLGTRRYKSSYYTLFRSSKFLRHAFYYAKTTSTLLIANKLWRLKIRLSANTFSIFSW